MKVFMAIWDSNDINSKPKTQNPIKMPWLNGLSKTESSEQMQLIFLVWFDQTWSLKCLVFCLLGPEL